MKKTALTAATVAALCIAPAAGAHPAERGDGHSRGKERSAKERSAKRCERARVVGFAVKGTLTGYDAETITLDVVRGNRHARRYLETQPATFSLADARLRFRGVTDANSDGNVDFADVASTDSVKAIGRIAVPRKRCEGEASVVIGKVKVVREAVEEEPAADAPAPGDEQPPA